MNLRQDALDHRRRGRARRRGARQTTGRAGRDLRAPTCAGPNVRNVVPGRVIVSAELRDEDAETLLSAKPVFERAMHAIAARRGLTIAVTWGQYVPPVSADAVIVEVIRGAAERSGRPWSELTSGAGHDAQIVGRAFPIGMIFVPSIGGISHSPAREHRPGSSRRRRASCCSTRWSRSISAWRRRRSAPRHERAYPAALGRRVRRARLSARHGRLRTGTTESRSWPNGARIAVSFVLNIEEGGENNVLARRPGLGDVPFRDRRTRSRSPIATSAWNRCTSTAAGPACGECSGSSPTAGFR